MKQHRVPTLQKIKNARAKIGRTVLHAAVAMLNCGPRAGLQESRNHGADGDE